MYDTATYASSRLIDTIVRINDKPVTVNDCHQSGSDIVIGFRYLTNGAQNTALLENFDLTPVSLGFAESGGHGAAYLARIPKRSDYRQGLRTSNYHSLFGDEHRRVSSKNLAKTIMGVYPSFESVLDEASNQPTFRPFSRNFALSSKHGGPGINILFKWFGVVGNVVEDRPLLLGNFEHLQESFEESIR